MEILNIAYAAAFGIAWVAAIRSPYSRIFPLWTGFAFVSATQGINVQLGNISDLNWAQTWWQPIEAVVMVFTALALIEAVWLRTSGLDPVPRFWLRFGVALMPGSVIIYLAHWPHGTEYSEFLAIREWFWLWLALSGVTAWLFFAWRAVRCQRSIRKHCAILTFFVVTHSLAAPQIHFHWIFWRIGYRAAAILACVLWVRNCASVRRALYPPSPAAYSSENHSAPALSGQPQTPDALPALRARTAGQG